MELWRRVFLLSSFFAAILFALYADLSPVVIVQHIDFRDKQKGEGSYMGVRLMTERTERLAGLTLHDYIAETTKGRLFNVEGRGWEPAVENAVAARGSRALAKEWQIRLPSDQHPMGVLFFRPEEAPVNQLATLFQKSNDPVFLVQGAGEKAVYLKAERRIYSNDDFRLGGGFTNYPTPPTDFLFPGRKWSPWVVAAGLVLYIALPWPRRPREALAYKRWRVVLCDVAALILTVPFFSFPFFITGGTVQAFTEGWPLFFFFWPIAFIGLVLVWLAEWYSSFALLPLEDRLRIWGPRGERDFPFAEMDFFQPVLIKPPKWLIVLSWVAALSGKGSSRIGATGRAMMISSAEWGSLAIRLKNGKDLFISITDQLGTDTLGADKIVGALKNAGVREEDDVREVRSLGLEMVRLPAP
jgi:hypothetical protein